MTTASEGLSRRLRQTDFSEADCLSALRGEALPENLGNDVARLCLVAGIRQHLAFAKHSDVEELCALAGPMTFSRARNARLIMSNEIPTPEQMDGASSYPYCVWYPDLAHEDTYRKLVAAFPDMRYQVGRACAVAGYVDLYLELDLLPDVSIAEEAREAGRASCQGSLHIFNHIMAAPVRYSVMNDYELTVELHTPKPGAFLNADTAVCARLEGRKAFNKAFGPWRYFNITEDWGIAETSTKIETVMLSDDESAILGVPLPFDLPTIHKDLLVLAAAAEGNVDRYVRLRRPHGSVAGELHCLVSGIYKSTAMALWLECNPDVMRIVAAAWDEDEISALRRAIYARHVMNNDTSRLLKTDPRVPDEELPYWIWYPTLPSPYTLVKIAEARPAMRQQCVRACMAGGHRWAYNRIMNMPDQLSASGNNDEEPPIPLAADPVMIYQAKLSLGRDFYLQDMKRRREEAGLELGRIRHAEKWKCRNPWTDQDTSSTVLQGFLRDSSSEIAALDQFRGFFEETLASAEMGGIRFYLSSPLEMREQARASGGSLVVQDNVDFVTNPEALPLESGSRD